MSCDSGAGAECDGDVAEEVEASVQLSLKQQLNLAIQRSMSYDCFAKYCEVNDCCNQN
jgi:hypothetical protein